MPSFDSHLMHTKSTCSADSVQATETLVSTSTSRVHWSSHSQETFCVDLVEDDNGEGNGVVGRVQHAEQAVNIGRVVGA